MNRNSKLIYSLAAVFLCLHFFFRIRDWWELPAVFAVVATPVLLPDIWTLLLTVIPVILIVPVGFGLFSGSVGEWLSGIGTISAGLNAARSFVRWYLRRNAQNVPGAD
jgi:signal transduction histidine kinase